MDGVRQPIFSKLPNNAIKISLTRIQMNFCEWNAPLDARPSQIFVKIVGDGVALKINVQFKDLNLNSNLCKSVDIRFN